MRAGERDRRIVIQRATVTTNAFGEEIPDWATIATVWAKRTPIMDGERWRAGEIAANLTERFLINWSSTVADVSPTDRIRYNSRVYDIAGVKEIGRRKSLEITAAARNDDARDAETSFSAFTAEFTSEFF